MLEKDNLCKKISSSKRLGQPTTTGILTDAKISQMLDYYSVLQNNQYIDLIYMLLKKNYIYFRELKKIKNINWEHYILNLRDKGIITEIKVNEDILFYLRKTKQLGNYHIKKMTFYGLSGSAMSFYGNEEVLFYLQDKVTDKTLEKIERDIMQFNEVFNNEKQRIINEKKQKELMFRILKQKQTKTGDDYARLQMLEKELYG